MTSQNLKGHKLFNPEDLLDTNSDESDKIYLAEYNLRPNENEEDNSSKVKSYKLPFNLKKNDLSPKKKIIPDSERNLKKNLTYNEIREKSSNFKNNQENIAIPYSQTILKIKEDILERAFNLESDERTKRNNVKLDYLKIC
jgi:hypothetical protein